MKKNFLLLVILVSSFSFAQAQSTRFGFTAGATLATQKIKVESVSIKSDGKIGFTAGVFADIALSEKFAFQPGLNFTQKGGKFDGGEFAEDDVTMTLNYLELPLNVLYKAPAGNGKFFFGLGPSIAFGLSGKAKSGGESEDINFGSDENEDAYKPLDFGGNIVAGYELSSGLLFSVNFNTTLNNINTTSDATVRNTYFGLRIGYLLGGNK
ncbi:porin family protein [Lacibacter sp.]|uniref:porin family protein n=1 Tax=Lacibacter sp. TaxID=1915409 RepID=UPI002B4ADCCC|nr:porin family protein [Lacibacter sp.]HLP37268.1 porin family protein [Lacibacter sp.]